MTLRGTSQPARHRVRLLVAVLAVIALGLSSRRFPWLLPEALGKYPGDALWTVMVFFAWGLVFPRTSTLQLGILALLTSFGVEFLQLYQAAWINAVRRTTLGHLVLGSTFGWLDLLAYTAGAALAMVLDLCARTALRAPPRHPG